MKPRTLQQMLVIFFLLLAIAPSGCKLSRNAEPKAGNANATASPAKPDSDGVIHSGSGEEKEKPEAGKANVQGKVLFNDKPAAGIEVKLCEKFSQFFSGCGG